MSAEGSQWETLPSPQIRVLGFKVVCGRKTARLPLCEHVHSDPLVESLALHADAVPDAYGEVEALGCSIIPPFSRADLQHHQRSDPVIGKVISLLESGNGTDSFELKFKLKERKRFKMKSNLLYKACQLDVDITYPFVVPMSLRSPILSWLH